LALEDALVGKNMEEYYSSLSVSFGEDGGTSSINVAYVPYLGSECDEEATVIISASLDPKTLVPLDEVSIVDAEPDLKVSAFVAQHAQGLMLADSGRSLALWRHQENGEVGILIDLSAQAITHGFEMNFQYNRVAVMAFLAQDVCLVMEEDDSLHGDISFLALHRVAVPVPTSEEAAASASERQGDNIIMLQGPIDPSPVPHDDGEAEEFHDLTRGKRFLGSNKAKTMFAIFYPGHDLISVYDIDAKVVKSVKLLGGKRKDRPYYEEGDERPRDAWLSNDDSRTRNFQSRLRFDESFNALVDLQTLTIYADLFGGKKISSLFWGVLCFVCPFFSVFPKALFLERSLLSLSHTTQTHSHTYTHNYRPLTPSFCRHRQG